MKKEDLHKIAPQLSEISLNNNGFEVPENYFRTIEDGVMVKLKTEKFPKKIGYNTSKTPENYFKTIEDIIITKLKAEAIHGKDTPSVPEKYFDSIEETVLTKIKDKTTKVSLKNKLIKIIAPIAIAASLLLIFMLKDNPSKITFDSLAATEIEDWINNNSIDIDALSIISMYPEIELNNEMLSVNISNEEVLEYLYKEDLDEIIYEN
ncbi:hypothetical protein [Lutibacter sp.]|uniref:hypothetical protein n=1 Tax=Lutibacter sp. TaxID=1925666 RepID=UPI0025B8F157|nr:hypothetical protein [Lutibacter sp.]MCF6169137.1 hypothetical protein [Lutibacter sp.]